MIKSLNAILNSDFVGYLEHSASFRFEKFENSVNFVNFENFENSANLMNLKDCCYSYQRPKTTAESEPVRSDDSNHQDLATLGLLLFLV